MTGETLDNDNGSLRTVAYDVGNQHEWSFNVATYDTQGRLTDQTLYNDDGSRRIDVYDAGDQHDW